MAKGSGSKGGGILVLIVAVMLLSALLWGLALALVLGGVALIIGGPLVGLALAAYGWMGVIRRRGVISQTEEIRQIAGDADTDLNELQMQLDYLALTKGIGTDLSEEDRAELRELRNEAKATQALLGAAVTPANLHEAIVEAERLRLRARTCLP